MFLGPDLQSKGIDSSDLVGIKAMVVCSGASHHANTGNDDEESIGDYKDSSRDGVKCNADKRSAMEKKVKRPANLARHVQLRTIQIRVDVCTKTKYSL